jgi:hypothetical protein
MLLLLLLRVCVRGRECLCWRGYGNRCDKVHDTDLEVLAPAVPKLEALHLAGCDRIGDRGVRAVAKRCFHLEVRYDYYYLLLLLPRGLPA